MTARKRPDPNDMAAAHDRSFRNRACLSNSTKAGCFYCQRVFEAREVTEYNGQGQTAFCPHCRIDAVMGDDSGYPVTDTTFLGKMHEYWFTKSVEVNLTSLTSKLSRTDSKRKRSAS